MPPPVPEKVGERPTEDAPSPPPEPTIADLKKGLAARDKAICVLQAQLAKRNLDLLTLREEAAERQTNALMIDASAALLLTGWEAVKRDVALSGVKTELDPVDVWIRGMHGEEKLRALSEYGLYLTGCFRRGDPPSLEDFIRHAGPRIGYDMNLRPGF